MRFTLIFIILFQSVLGAEPLPVSIEPDILDFGQVKESEGTLDLQFAIHNQSSEPIEIANIHTTYGCTVVALKERTVPANGKIDVPVKVTITYYKGKFDKSISIELTGKKETITIPVRGFVIQDIWYEDVMIQIFPKATDTAVEKEFEVFTLDYPDVQFGKDSLDKDFSLQELSRTKRDDGKTSIKFKLTVQTPKQAQSQKSALTLLPTDSKIKPLTIPVGIYPVRAAAMKPLPEVPAVSKDMSSPLFTKRGNLGVVRRGGEGNFDVFGTMEFLQTAVIDRIENFPEGTKINIQGEGIVTNTDFSWMPREMRRKITVSLPEKVSFGMICGTIYFRSPDGRTYSVEAAAFVGPKRQ